ncbi:MAG TPA: hypothetical protein VHT97_04385 [Acidimicrobiales bacterium]|jgi:hypothetical protein|nr:hypothetical protein [Acidimicrobiales bacterium]
MMVKVGVLAHFEFKAGHDQAVEDFFRNGRIVVEGQPASTLWYAFRDGPTSYGAFAAFASETDRDALLAAGGPKASAANAGLFERPPTFQKVDIVAGREPLLASPSE